MTRSRLLTLPLAALLLGLAAPVLAEVPATLPAPAPATADEASLDGHATARTHGPDGTHLDRGRQPGGTVVAENVDATLSPAWPKNDPLPVVATDQADTFTALSQVHLVYLHGSEVKKPRTQFLTMFETDARAAQRFLTAKHGRSVRFDEARSGRLDITTVKSRYRTSQLGTGNQFDLVKRELQRVFPDVGQKGGKKYVAWLDAPSRYCGQGELYGDWHRDQHNYNDWSTVGVVYRPSDAGGPDGGFCRGRTLLHELGHNLGALYEGAPNQFDGAHCADDKNDVMCYQDAVTSGFDSGTTGSPGEFDHGYDDYWDAGATPGSTNAGEAASGAHLMHLNWWTANLSRFVCRPSAQGAEPDCANPATHYASPDEFRYHSGDETDPPPAEQPVG